jgi:hypothetical protein
MIGNLVVVQEVGSEGRQDVIAGGLFVLKYDNVGCRNREPLSRTGV